MKFDVTLERLNRMDRAASLYIKGSSLRQAAKATSVSYSGLRKWMVARDIDRRPPGRHLKASKQQIKDMVRMHHKERKSLREISKATGFDRGAITLAIHKAGFMTQTAKQMRTVLQQRRDDEHKQEVLGLYDEGYPIREIAAHLHTDARRVRRILQGRRALNG